MRNLYIIGAGDLGRELETWMKDDLKFLNIKLMGFLDKNQKALEGFQSDYKIISDEDDCRFTTNDYAIIAIANSSIRQKIYEKLNKKVKFINYISSRAIIGKFCEFGNNIIVSPFSVISTGVKIDNCVFMNVGCKIGHDVKIEAFATLYADVNIGGDCIIGRHAILGTNSVVHPRKSIGENSIVGLGSVVIKNVKPFSTVVGNPALRVK